MHILRTTSFLTLRQHLHHQCICIISMEPPTKTAMTLIPRLDALDLFFLIAEVPFFQFLECEGALLLSAEGCWTPKFNVGTLDGASLPVGPTIKLNVGDMVTPPLPDLEIGIVGSDTTIGASVGCVAAMGDMVGKDLVPFFVVEFPMRPALQHPKLTPPLAGQH
jgi:hypothetical protein